jgi:hypothetical protein
MKRPKDLLQFLLLFGSQLDAAGLHRVSWGLLAASWRPFSMAERLQKEEKNNLSS